MSCWNCRAFVFRVIPRNEVNKCLICKLEVHLSTCTIYHNVCRNKTTVWYMFEYSCKVTFEIVEVNFLEYISIKYIVHWNYVGLE